MEVAGNSKTYYEALERCFNMSGDVSGGMDITEELLEFLLRKTDDMETITKLIAMIKQFRHVIELYELQMKVVEEAINNTKANKENLERCYEDKEKILNVMHATRDLMESLLEQTIKLEDKKNGEEIEKLCSRIRCFAAIITLYKCQMEDVWKAIVNMGNP